MRATQQIVKNRSGTLAKEAAYDDRGQYASWDLPGSFLEGSGCLPGLSWAHLGRIWAASEQLLAALGHVWGSPGTLLGLVLWLLLPFVAALGQFWCVLARSGLDFVGFQMAPGRILKLQGLIFRRFCMHARLRGRNAQNVTKPQF